MMIGGVCADHCDGDSWVRISGVARVWLVGDSEDERETEGTVDARGKIICRIWRFMAILSMYRALLRESSRLDMKNAARQKERCLVGCHSARV